MRPGPSYDGPGRCPRPLDPAGAPAGAHSGEHRTYGAGDETGEDTGDADLGHPGQEDLREHVPVVPVDREVTFDQVRSAEAGPLAVVLTAPDAAAIKITASLSNKRNAKKTKK